MVKAGVMVRETLTNDSRNAFMYVNAGGDAGFQWRAATRNFSSYRESSNYKVTAPYWLKIVRSADWIGGYRSPDGLNWTMVDWETISNLAPQIYVGLALTGGNQQGLPATAEFNQVTIGSANPSEVLNPQVGTGDGLEGSYRTNQYLFGQPVLRRVDQTVNFNSNHPFTRQINNSTNSTASMARRNKQSGGEQFSVRWTGELQAQFTEPYTLSVEGVDGVRLWLNEQLIVDDWICRGTRKTNVVVNLVAGQKYLLRMEHFEHSTVPLVSLSWSSPSTPKRVIPQSQLYSQPTDTDGNGLPDLWEQHYFGQIGVDTNADLDGDGLSNLQEYHLHHDPTDPLFWGVPNEWTHGDIGLITQVRGDASYSNGVFTVGSIGQGQTQYRDDFHYVFQSLGTNGELVARVLNVDGTQWRAKAGLMLRESLDSHSRSALLALTWDNLLSFQTRELAGQTTGDAHTQTNRLACNWLKLVRTNDWVGGYVSTDGTSWQLFDWVVLNGLAPQAYIGLVVNPLAPRTQNANKTKSTALVKAQFDQVSYGLTGANDVMQPVVGTGDGLLASFRSDSLLYLPGLTNRVDPEVDFRWTHSPPVSSLNPDSYGVCWSGEIEAQFSELYTIALGCRREDWVRVWINDQLIIDGWRTWHADTLFKGNIQMVAGQHYLIRVEMFNNLGRGRVQLFWNSPSTPRQVIPQSQLYSHPVDTDGHGLPDLWQMLYFGHLGVDPNADPDGDGLSNLQEYQYHTNPTKADTDGDGLPDAWEIAHGLDPQYADDASLDYNNSGWSNLQDYQFGLDPLNADANGDGLPDSFAVQYLGGNAATSHADRITVVAAVNGAQATNYLGNWQVDGNDIYALDRRGGLDFNLTVGNADKYVLNVIGMPNQFNPFVNQFKLLLGIDGQTLGHYNLPAVYGTNSEVALVLPYLQAGAHKVHLFWDGYASFSSLRIKQVKLLAVSGTSTNANGLKDWVNNMIQTESGMDATNGIIGSYTSPVCLEGRDAYPALMQMTNSQTNALSPVATTDNRWYVNVPLQANTQTVFQASYQNGALTDTRNLQWLPVNVLTMTNSLTIRSGDSLLISALPVGKTNGNLQVVIGTNTYSGKAAKGIACNFTSSGVQTINATWTSATGSSQSGSVTVDVVQSSLPKVEPAAWTWMQRNLNLPNLAPEAALQSDSRLTCTITGTNAAGATVLNLATGDNEERTILARLGTNGPVLDSTRVTGFDVWSGDQAYTKVLQDYPDGSQMVEMLMIASPVNTNVTFVMVPIVSGVIFDDGTTMKTLTATNFDALGQCPIRFIRPATAKTSVCNSITGYQGKHQRYQIGYRH